MGRYRGNVEQARKDLLGTGVSARGAHAPAPGLAQAREEIHDRETRPYSWLGGKAIEKGGAR